MQVLRIERPGETTENSIKLLQEALDRFGWLTSIREVMTIMGRSSMLISEIKMITRIASSRISLKNKIIHILSPIKRPQVNDKIEKRNDTYEKNRFKFDSFDKFMDWYNTVRFHESLDTKRYLQTPDITFWARLPEGCKLAMFLNLMETGSND